MPGTNPKAVLARMLTESPGVASDDGIRVVELPTGTAFLFESVRETVAPGMQTGDPQEPREGTVWQGTVAIPDLRASSVIVVQLVTSAIDRADDYLGVLLGTARTVSFTDPSQAGSGPQFESPSAPGSAMEAMRSDFG
ncbi:hypothetical protein P8605_02060 [Streptomyces sp. T-3]|nr:hypothetical protein [Streptomyces sp. T-3]